MHTTISVFETELAARVSKTIVANWVDGNLSISRYNTR
ncbi:MAG: hypothetical protein ACI8PB_003683 [Desulforhopalus sp.]|jgi:hypothetical protein